MVVGFRDLSKGTQISLGCIALVLVASAMAFAVAAWF